MSERYKHPEVTDYSLPSSEIAMMREDLRLYKTHDDYCEQYKALFDYYGNTPFVKALRRYAAVVDVAVGSEEDTTTMKWRNIDHGFLAGATMAVHNRVWWATQYAQRHLLSNDPFSGFDDLELPVAEANLETMVSGMKKWDEIGFYAAFDAQSKEMQDLLQESAGRMFEGTSDYMQKSFRFMSGYMFCRGVLKDRQKSLIG